MPTADELLGRDVVRQLADTVEKAIPGRSLVTVRRCIKQLAGRGLRERSDLLKDALLADLPGDFADLEHIFRVALADEDFTGWLIWPVSEALVERALAEGTPKAFDAALELLAMMTSRLTGEFAIRRLLEADLNRAIPIVLGWTTHPDEHVRRLATEGTRPHLPWAKKVKAILAAPESTVPILDALYRDKSEYVRRSVANHLNDLARLHPDLVATIAARWLAEPDDNTAQLVRHGLRTLIKKAHPASLALLGFAPTPEVIVTGPVLVRDEVVIGEELAFQIMLENGAAEPAVLAVDYIVYHRKANGTQTAKVFKLATKKLAPKETVTISRKHSFKKITTRVYHPGEHAIEIQVNGAKSGRVDFQLHPESP